MSRLLPLLDRPLRPVRWRGWAPCIEGLGRPQLDDGCPWCSRDICQRPSGRLYRHHDYDGGVCSGSGRVPTPRVVTVQLPGAVL